MKKILIFTASLLFGGSLLAQYQDNAAATSSAPMTLHECMVYAVSHSPKTRIQELTNDSRKYLHRDATLAMVPYLYGSVGGSMSFGRSIDPETNTYDNIQSFSNSYGASAGVTLFNGFATIDKIKNARIVMMMGVEEAQQVEDELCLQVIQAFYNVLYYKGMVNLCQQQLDESKTNLEQTRLKEELGLKSYSDVLQIESEVAANDYNLVRVQNALEANIITLKEKMFYPSDEPLEIDNHYPEIVDPFLGNISSGELFQQAMEYMPNVKLADFQIRQMNLQLHNAKWSLLPSLTASGGYSTGYITQLGKSNQVDPFWDQLGNRQGQSLSISMSIPIFDGLQRQSAIHRSRNELRIAQAKRDQTLRELESAISGAIQDMEGSAKEFIQADKRVAAQNQAHKANQRKYDEGLLSILELHTSANQNMSSKSERLNAAFSYLLKRHVVNYYQGVSYINQE